MKIYDNTKYAFITSIIRVMESRMLSQGDVERMIGAKDAKDAFRVLNDLDYADYLGDAEKVDDFQIVVNEGLMEVKKILETYAPYPEILDALWLRFDFHNLKVLLKAKIRGNKFEDIENILMPLGKYDIEVLQSFFNVPTELQKMEMSNKEKQFRDVLEQAENVFKEVDDPIFIDGILDKAYFNFINKKFRIYGIKFLNEYYDLMVDLVNIRTYLRCVTLGKKDVFEKLYIEGASLAKESFEGNLDEFSEKMKNTLYAEIILKGVKEYQSKKSFAQLEKEIDAFLLEYMSKARFIALGVEPLFAFFWMKENNAQVIRAIMVNKLNDIDPSEIRKKIRKLYQ